jgi:ABC-type Mn2+/Zn2+ transport system ATPase subunit
MQAVQNHHGVKFDQIFLDEALDGMDDALKIKAFGLLQTLEQSYESVFVVEHNQELKARFESSYIVRLINGKSEIEKT